MLFMRMAEVLVNMLKVKSLIRLVTVYIKIFGRGFHRLGFKAMLVLKEKLLMKLEVVMVKMFNYTLEMKFIFSIVVVSINVSNMELV